MEQRLFNSVEDIWKESLELPFVKEMIDGSLPIEKFKFYMEQDYIYLKQYMKILVIIAEKTETIEDLEFMLQNTKDIIDETTRVHIPYMKELGIKNIESVKPHIDTLAYISYLINIAKTGDYLDGLLAILNCSWSYAYIGEEVFKKHPEALEHEVYGQWFKGYSCSEYQEVNRLLIDKVERLSESISEERKRHLCDVFRNCGLFEQRFWKMAYIGGER